MTTSPRHPDFFLIGAPKCGTTALDEYLKLHPDVFMPLAKEMHFFGSDLDFRRPRMTEDLYLSYFADAGAKKRVGESSVFYLYSRLAPKEIRAFAPKAQAIAILRDPVEMIHSIHSQLLYVLEEEIENLDEALAAEEDRRAGRRIPETAWLVDRLYYRAVADYAPQVRRWFEAFGRENVKVLLYEDFARDTPGAFREVLEFLGVDPSFRPEFLRYNANKRYRFRWLSALLNKPPLALREAVLRYAPRKFTYASWRMLLAWNSRFETRAPLDVSTRRRLADEFRPRVDDLATLLGRDLSHWCRVPAA